MALVKPYHKYRGMDSFSAQDLVAVATDLLRTIAPVQVRYRVGTVPTTRSLRFYTARGVVDRPLRSPAGRVRYGYRHLLQILVVKHLQAQYLPLVKIRSLTQGADNKDLELLLPEAGPAPARLLAGGRALAPRGTAAAAPPDAGGESAPLDGEAWIRVEVGPGIELHVHHAALAPGDRQRLRGALLREVGRLRGWKAP